MNVMVFGSFEKLESKDHFVSRALVREGHNVFEYQDMKYPMRIMIFGEFKDRYFKDCENLISEGFANTGHIVYKFDKTNVKIGENMIKYYKREILSRCKEFQPDMILFIKPVNIPQEEFEEIVKECNCKVAMWNFDWMLHPEHKDWFTRKAKVCHFVFGTDGHRPDELEYYREEGINRFELHQGCDKYKHHAINELTDVDWHKYGCDVAFVGSMYTQEREKLDRFLKTNFNYRLFGNTKENMVWFEEFSKLCKCAKIIVGDNFVNDVDGYWSDRVYLTLGSGGFFLTRYVKDLEKVFTNREHLVWWETYEDLEREIKYYLEHKEERDKIAWQGYIYVHTNHTYDIRCRQLIDIVKNNRKMEGLENAVQK